MFMYNPDQPCRLTIPRKQKNRNIVKKKKYICSKSNNAHISQAGLRCKNRKNNFQITPEVKWQTGPDKGPPCLGHLLGTKIVISTRDFASIGALPSSLPVTAPKHSLLS